MEVQKDDMEVQEEALLSMITQNHIFKLLT